MYGYIYKTENILNNKIYIGQKKSKLFLEDHYLGSGKYLKAAINKYGPHNFKVTLIQWCYDKESLNNREIYWISYYKEKGYDMYNISKGGDGGDTYLYLSKEERKLRCQKASEKSYFRHCTKQDRKKAWETRRKNGNDKFSEEYRKKLSESHKGKQPSKESILKGLETKRKNYNGQYHHSEETRTKISKSNKGKKKNFSKEALDNIRKLSKLRIGDKNGFYGKSHTIETKQIISETSILNWKNNKYKWVYNEKGSFRVPEKDVIKYINQGYKAGRGKLK